MSEIPNKSPISPPTGSTTPHERGMQHVIRNLIWAGAGAVVAWVSIYGWGESTRWDPSGPVADAPAELRAASDRAPAARSEPGADAERPDDPEHLAAAPAPAEIVTEPAPVPASTDSAPAEPARPTVVWFAPKDARPVYTDIPNRHADDATGSRPATDLLDSARITCEFGAGSNTGSRIGDSLSVGSGGAQWQGSLMVYDFLEPSGGKVRLTGTVGAVGSPTGEATVQFTVAGSRIYFMGFLPNGMYILTTVYEELDNMDRHVAVMSRHGEGLFNYGSQFLGVCY